LALKTTFPGKKSDTRIEKNKIGGRDPLAFIIHIMIFSIPAGENRG